MKTHDEMAAAVKDHDASRVNRLLQAGVTPSSAILCLAVREKDHLVLEALVKSSAQINAIDGWGYTPLVQALKSKDYHAADILLKAGAGLNAPSKFGPPLDYAVTLRLTDAVRFLIERGANLEQLNSARATPLTVAAMLGNAEAVQLLLKNGCNPNAVDGVGRTALDWAKENKQKSVVALMLRYGSRRAKKAETLQNAIRNNDVTAFNRLMHASVDLNKRDNFGWTALECAIDRNSEPFVRHLVRAGAEVNSVNYNGVSPLELAVRQWKPRIIKLLLNSGAIPNPGKLSSSDPLLTACAMSDPVIASELLRRGSDPNAANGGGTSALMTSARVASVALVQLLIKAGANVGDEDQQGCTAMFYAARTVVRSSAATRRSSVVSNRELSSAKILKLLLKHGAEINHRDEAGLTPIMITNSTLIAKILIDNNASLVVRDKRGRDVRHWLRKHKVHLA